MVWFFKSKGKREINFWGWFQENQEDLFSIQTGQEAIIAKLAQNLSKVHDGLSFEFGPLRDGKREFFISGSGLKDVFPAVESLHACAPALEKWVFVKYKQRKEIGELHFTDKIINGSNVFYALNDEDEMIGIDLFFEDYREELMGLYGNVGFVFLDNALGEFDVVTKVGKIRFRNIQDDTMKRAKPIMGLATDFDSLWKKKNAKK